MGKFDSVIIVSDIDGTFLGKGGRMVPENLEAIEYFKREGGSFTIATGREVDALMLSMLQPEKICNIPIIACNGAYIYDPIKKEIVLEHHLPEPEISRMVEAAREKCPELAVRIAVGSDFWTERLRQITKNTYPRSLHRFQIMKYEDMPHGVWHKAAWDGTPEELTVLRQVLEEAQGEECIIQLGESTILEIQSKYATKGTMLAELKKLTGKEDAVLYAIGDYENDYTMLQMADRRAIPSNAIDRLRELPDLIEVCHHDRGAIADLIRYIEAHL